MPQILYMQSPNPHQVTCAIKIYTGWRNEPSIFLCAPREKLSPESNWRQKTKAPLLSWETTRMFSQDYTEAFVFWTPSKYPRTVSNIRW